MPARFGQVSEAPDGTGSPECSYWASRNKSLEREHMVKMVEKGLEDTMLGGQGQRVFQGGGCMWYSKGTEEGHRIG